MERIKKSKALLLILLCLSLHSMAQTDAYRWQSPLVGLTAPGYYRLMLSPEVRARAVSDGSDFRIVDSAGDYMPYLLHGGSARTATEGMFVLAAHTYIDSTTETIIIENDGRQLSQLVLTLRNKAQSTPVQLSGSDDGKQWYDINSNIILSGSSEMNADTFDQEVSFPRVSYRRLRLTIRADKTLPVNILRASIATTVYPGSEYETLPAPRIMQYDSVKKTYVYADYPEAYTIDRLGIDVSGARLYHREASFFSRDTSGWEMLTTRELSSGQPNEMNIHVRSKHLLIVISNQDDKPLHIDSIHAQQLSSYIDAYFDADRNYFLVFGNPKAVRPTYDLKYFEDSIRNSVVKRISCGPISANKIIPGTEPIKKPEMSKGWGKWWLWPVLIAVLGLLLFFTIRVSRDIHRDA